MSVQQHSILNAPPPYFFTASPAKLILMSVCTMGFYELYWFYKNWVLCAGRSEKKIRPIWRAVFAPIWVFSLFKIIKGEAEEYKVPQDFRPTLLGIVYIVLSCLMNLPDPYWLLSYLTVVPIVLANNMASAVNERIVPGFVENDRFSLKNWLALGLGGIVFVLILIGTFYPDAMD